jgi:DNA-directed RNA polymerase specialized sigma24 family protein
MGDAADPSPDLIQRLRAGDPHAADALFALYAQRLTRIAEQHLSARLAGRLDDSDVVQSVFRTFFRRSAEGEFRIDSSAQLWRLLVKITLLKACAKCRHHTAGIRDVGAEALPNPGGDDWLVAAVAREPDPLEAVMLVDQIETLLQGLPPLYCHVLDLRLQGFGPTEIAARLNVARQTVHRALGLLQERLENSSRGSR